MPFSVSSTGAGEKSRRLPETEMFMIIKCFVFLAPIFMKTYHDEMRTSMMHIVFLCLLEYNTGMAGIRVSDEMDKVNGQTQPRTAVRVSCQVPNHD